MIENEAVRVAQARGWRPFALVLGSVVGACLQLGQAVLWEAWTYAALASGVVLAWPVWRRLAGRSFARRWRRWQGLSGWTLEACLLIGMAAGFAQVGLRAAAYARGAIDPAMEGRDIEVIGVVARMPERGDGRLRFVFDIESARFMQGQGEALHGWPERVSLGWYEPGAFGGRASDDGRPAPSDADERLALPALHAGERWRLVVRLKAPHGARNPHGFDEELRAWEAGLRANGYVRPQYVNQRMGQTFLHPIERAREAVRDAIFERVADARQAGVIAALVTGDQGAIASGDWEVFRMTGVAHLMSISGLHITMFAWLSTLAVSNAWRRNSRMVLAWPAPEAARFLGVAMAAAYALFSGWGVPAQRTVWMLAMAVCLRAGGRRWPWPCVWLAVCAAVVAVDPWSLLSAGFWLSFVAVGLLFATDAGASQAVASKSGLGALGKLVREQALITLGLAPLTLLLFQQVSIVGLLANALAIPRVTLVLTPLAMLGVALPWLWHLAAWAAKALMVVLDLLATWPYASLTSAAPPLWMAAAGVLGAALATMRLPWSMRFAGAAALVPALLYQAPRPADGEFEVLAADVGQGNAVLVRTATHALLYDAGPKYGPTSDAGQRVLVPLLRALGERLDLLMLSHRDSDHTGGAAAVLQSQPGASLSSSIEPAHPLQRLRAARPCMAGQAWRWDGIDFELLHPSGPLPDELAQRPGPNAISCVLRITNGRRTVLLAGDIEAPQETALIERYGDRLRADLLLVPHHGSRTSSSEAFLDRVQPRWALVQAGYRNRFGHPVDAVMERYRARGTLVIDSVRCGAARWHTDRMPLNGVSCERKTARHYWQHHLPSAPWQHRDADSGNNL